MNFLKSQTVLITIGLAILALIVALVSWLHPFSGERLSLDVAISQNVELTSNVNLSRNGSIQFVYNGEKVQNLISTKIRFKNSGNQPLSEKDFIRGVKVVFPADTRIISNTLMQVQPLHNYSFFQQGFVVKIDENSLNFTPVLINPQEIFDLDILTTRNLNGTTSLAYGLNEISLDYKIYGISKINSVSKIKTNGEKRQEAREEIKGILKSIGFIVLIILSLFVLGFFADFISKKFPNLYKNNSNSEIVKRRSTLFTFMWWSFIVILFLFITYILVYNAYFIEV